MPNKWEFNTVNIRQIIKASQLGLVLLAGVSSSAHAVHLDVEVWGDGDRMSAGFCRTAGAVGCDLAQLIASLQLPPNTLPTDGATGKMIFLTDFRDFSGGPNKTPNPGFQAVQNALNPGELIRYRALGILQYWDTTSRTWNPAPANVRIKLAGGVDPGLVITDYNQCGGQLFCFAGTGNQSAVTLYRGTGVSGSAEMVVDAGNNQGSMHTHLNWFLENNAGVIGGPIGAYMLEMQILSNQRSQPSESFYVMFNGGLALADFSEALLDRVSSFPVAPPSSTLPVIASAGADRVARLGSTIALDASASIDPQPGPSPLSYNWTQTVGTAVSLVGGNQQTANFLPNVAGNYTFNLSVSDGSTTSYDEVTYTVPNIGDVDLDGDIDRIDVALILLGATQSPNAVANDVRDLDGNGVITSNDASIAKVRCSLRLCYPTRR